jgi:hypothetical protein
MKFVQGRLVLDITIQEGKLEKLLEMISRLNENNIELYELNVPLSNGSQEVKVDGVSVEWSGLYDEDGVEIKKDHRESTLDDRKIS